jgi:hypothetical protein
LDAKGVSDIDTAAADSLTLELRFPNEVPELFDKISRHYLAVELRDLQARGPPYYRGPSDRSCRISFWVRA